MPIVVEIDIEIPDEASVEVETPDVSITPSSGETVLLVASPGEPGPPGPPGEGVQVFGDLPSGIKDGINKIFTTSIPFRTNSTVVYFNGLREHYVIESPPNTIIFDEAPTSTDIILIDYIVL